MTQNEWLTTDDPFKLLRFLQSGRWWRWALPRSQDAHRPNARKMRLMACAYERLHCGDGCGGIVLAISERYADGEATLEELRDRTHDPEAIRLAGVDDEIMPTFQWWERNWRDNPTVHADSWAVRRVMLCRLLRCMFNPFRPVSVPASWLTSTVQALARQMYDSRDFSPMPILADALQDADCDNADMLSHCRLPGEHFRGCWVVDLLLGKS